MAHWVSNADFLRSDTAGGTVDSVSSVTCRGEDVNSDGRKRGQGKLTCQTNGRFFKLITARSKARFLHEASDVRPASISRVLSIIKPSADMESQANQQRREDPMV